MVDKSDFIDDSNVLALGVTPEEMMGKRKAETISSIKSIATTQDGTPLTTQNIASVLKTIETTVINRVNQMAVNTTKQFLPIDSQLKKVNDLLSSNSEKDIDKGFELIDRLQSRLGLDLSKYSKEIGDAVKKLYDMNAQRKEDKAEAKRIQIEKTEELTKERDILRERGINTVLNEKGNKLQILTRQQEREEIKRIKKEEKDIEKAKEKSVSDVKNLQREDKIIAKDRNKILKDNEKITKREEDLQKAKERIGLKPDQRGFTSGPLDQTVGEAIRSLKSFGKEILQLPKQLMGGFKALGGMVKSLGAGFLALAKPVAFVASVIAGVILMFLFLKFAIGKIVDFISEKIDKVKSFFGLGKKDSEKDQSKDSANVNKTTDEKIIGEDEDRSAAPYAMSPATDDRSAANAISPVDEQPDEVAEEFERNTGMRLTQRVPGRKVKRDASFIEPASYKQENLNKMSVENQVLSESKSASNTVIAPNVSNSNVNSSSTTAMTMEPTNFDRSFINLNSVPI